MLAFKILVALSPFFCKHFWHQLLSDFIGISFHEILSTSAFTRFDQHQIMSRAPPRSMREEWIVEHYLAFSHQLRGYGVHENMYDGVAIRYPTILGLWMGRELVTHPNNLTHSDIR